MSREWGEPDLLQLVFVGDASSDIYLHDRVDLHLRTRAMDVLSGFNLGEAEIEAVQEG